MVPVPDTPALVFYNTEPLGDNFSKDEFPPLPGALGDMVPSLQGPALVHDNTTQKGDGFSKNETFPGSGMAADPTTVVQAAHTMFVLPPGTCGVRPGNLPLVDAGATDGRFRRRTRGLSLEA